MMRPGLFDTDTFGDLFARAFGFGTCAEPPPRIPLRLLGLPGDTFSSVTREQVKSAFRAAVFKAHPDLNTYTDPGVRAAAEAAIADDPDVQELVWARDVLMRLVPEPVTDKNNAPFSGFSRHEPKPCPECKGERQRPDGRPYELLYSLYGQRKRWVGYCRACAHDAELQYQRDRRRERRADRTCQGCGTTFTPPRSDGRYCSPACRQKAYRRRKGGGSDG